MGRNVNQTEEVKVAEKDSLDTLINKYFANNKQKTLYTNLTKEQGTLIKDELKNRKLTSYTTDEVVATISISKSFEYDDDKLLEIAESLPEDYKARLIDTVRVVNLELLERMISNNEIKADIFNDALSEKVTEKLLVKPVKKEKEK